MMDHKSMKKNVILIKDHTHVKKLEDQQNFQKISKALLEKLNLVLYIYQIL